MDNCYIIVILIFMGEEIKFSYFYMCKQCLQDNLLCKNFAVL